MTQYRDPIPPVLDDEVTPVGSDLYELEFDPKVLHQALQEFRHALQETSRERDRLRADLTLAQSANEELRASYTSIEAQLQLQFLETEAIRANYDGLKAALQQIAKFITTVLD